MKAFPDNKEPGKFLFVSFAIRHTGAGFTGINPLNKKYMKPTIAEVNRNNMKFKRNLLIFGLLLLMSFTMIQPKPTRVIFFGDSITEMGTGKDGYITMIGKSLEEKGLSENYNLIGSGIGGNKIYDLYLRLEEDVLSQKPDVVVIFVGVNDVWHKTWGTGTDEDKFARFYTEVIHKIKAKDAKIILCTPAVIGEKTDFSNPQDGDLNQYSEIIRNLSKENNCQLCDLRKLFLAYNTVHNKENKPQGILTTDRVHLNNKGNKLVADALLEQIRGRQ
jgi:lysophospholipase L1-like esterase